MLKKNAALIVTVLIFAVILAGQTLSYYAVPYRYSACADVTAAYDGIDYSVSTNSSVTYTILAYDNARPAEKLYIYYDESYAVFGTTHRIQEEYISQLTVELRIRGYTDTETVNAARLSEIVSSGYNAGDAILITSGVLPADVYDGDTNLAIFDWVSSGGSLYWAGYAIGAKYADGKDLADVPSYQMNIFGEDDRILTEQMRSGERSDNELSKALAISYTGVTYGMSITSGTLSLGFECEYNGKVYSSASLTGHGSGMICVMGLVDDPTRAAMAQVISSGVSPSSGLIGTDSGTMVRSSVSGTISWDGVRTDVAVQVRMGDPNTVYARTFFF